ncbi:MAG: hypothetical protein AAGE65_05925 [Planctomycetota bacterium]
MTPSHSLHPDAHRIGAASRRGLVLIEALAYVVLLGVLAAGIMVSARLVQEGRGMPEVASRLDWLDAAARRAGDLSDGGVRLEIDLIGQQAALWVNGRTPASGDYRLTWPSDLRLQQVWVNGRRVVLGEASVRFGANGISETYGLEFYDQRDGRSWWRLTAGGSGQVRRLSDRAAMEEVFDALSRHDAG